MAREHAQIASPTLKAYRKKLAIPPSPQPFLLNRPLTPPALNLHLLLYIFQMPVYTYVLTLSSLLQH